MKGLSVKKLAVALPIICIVVLTTFFHFQVHYENALTLEYAADYEVSISVWRIIFEPLFGPLLYINRSLYALEEIPITLAWAILFVICFGMLKFFKSEFPSSRKSFFFGQLANLPLLIGIGFGIFVLILFIPLPNNTIVNNSKDSVLVTTHAHTEFSHDGLTSQEKMWKWHKRNGFDAFFITDHANHKKSLEFTQKQRNGEFAIDPLIMVGQEYSASNHMSLLGGLNGKFKTKGMSDKVAIDSVHHYGGAVIINHWFDGKGKEKEVYNDLGADGFEIENVGKELYYDREIFKELKEFCESNELMMVGGLDFHGYGRACSVYNAFEIPGWRNMDFTSKESTILDILKNGPQEKLEILMYKDRPYYTSDVLWYRPFLTVVNYFRTLNVFQTLSWVFWLLIIQFIRNLIKRRFIATNKLLVLLAGVSAMFLSILALVYYFRGEAVKGYSEVYSEYSGLLGPIGIVILLYTLIVAYFRFFKRNKQENPA